MSTRLRDKRALVTGATSNIGRAIAVAFAAEGAHVIVSGRNHERGTAVVDEIRAAGGQRRLSCCPSRWFSGCVQRSRRRGHPLTRRPHRRVRQQRRHFPGSTTAATDEATFDEVYGVNVKAPFFLTAAIAPIMAEQGSGAVINLGSWIARIGIPIGSLYSSTKGAIETLTRAWSAEFGPAGVRVNAISPGVVRTPDPEESSMPMSTPPR